MDRYSRYKKATRSFLDFVRGTSGLAVNGCSAFIAAIEAIKANAIPVPGSIFEQLRTAIALRNEAKNSLPAEYRDEGHLHFLTLLRKARQLLRPLVPESDERVGAGEKSLGAGDRENDVGNSSSYASLGAGADDDDGDVDEKEVSMLLSGTSNVDVHELRTATEEAKKEDEMKEKQLEACFFLLDADGVVSVIMEAWKDVKAGKIHLMTATAITNASLHHIEIQLTCLELKLDLGGMKVFTLAHVLVMVYLHSAVKQVMSLGGTYEQAVDILSEMFDLPPRKYPAAAAEIMKCTSCNEVEATSLLQDLLRQWTRISPWMLKWSQRLGPANPIVSTIKQVSGVLGVMKPNTRLICKPGFFGAPWDDCTRPAHSTSDLASFLMADVMPSLCLSDQQDTHMEEFTAVFHATCPIFEQMRVIVVQRKLSAILTFSLHILLLVVLEMQEPVQKTCQRILVTAKVTMSTLLRQIRRDRASGKLEDETAWMGLAEMDRVMTYLIERRDWQCPKVQADRSVYNPWMAGQHLLAVHSIVAMEAGVTVLDSVAQARLVLHIYNALRVLEFIKDPIPLFEVLIEALSKGAHALCRVGSLPKKPGLFMLGFLYSFGYDQKGASTMNAMLKTGLNSMLSDQYWQLGRSRVPVKGFTALDLKGNDPKEMSEMYRIVAMKDLSGVDGRQVDGDSFTTGQGKQKKTQQRRENGGTKGRGKWDRGEELSPWPVVAEKIRSTCEKDIKGIFGLNLAAVGALFLSIKEELVDLMGVRGVITRRCQEVQEQPRGGHSGGGAGGKKKSSSNKKKSKKVKEVEKQAKGDVDEEPEVMDYAWHATHYTQQLLVFADCVGAGAARGPAGNGAGGGSSVGGKGKQQTKKNKAGANAKETAAPATTAATAGAEDREGKTDEEGKALSAVEGMPAVMAEALREAAEEKTLTNEFTTDAGSLEDKHALLQRVADAIVGRIASTPETFYRFNTL